MKTQNPGCGCCTKKYNILKIDKDDGKIIWRRAVPVNKPSETHDLFEIRTCSDGTFVVCDYQTPVGIPDRWTGDRRISRSATSIISEATNRFADPNYVGNFNNVFCWHQIAVKWIDPIDEDHDIRDLVFTASGPEVCCNYASDFTRKWKQHFSSFSNTSCFYSAWNDTILAIDMAGGFTNVLGESDGSVLSSWRTPFAPFSGGYLNGHFIQDAGPNGILYMAAAAIFLTDWSGNLLLHLDSVFGAGTGWRAGVFSADGEHFYFTTGRYLAKFALDGTLIWNNYTSMFVETGDSGYTASLPYKIVELPDGNVVVAGEAFLMPKKDNDPQYDDSGFLIEWEYKNVLCYDPDGNLLWTFREDGQDHFGFEGTPPYLQRTGLTVSDDGHPVVTNYLFTPPN